MSGFSYFIRGLKLLGDREIRRFVLLPLLINLLIFIALSWYLLALTGDFTRWLIDTLGSWAEWFLWLIWLIVGALWLVVYGYSFSMISNSIAAPFYGLLAEKVQAKLTGTTPDQPFNLQTMSALVKRSFAREWQKLLYAIPRLLLLLLVSIPLYFIPVIGMAVPAIWFLWGAWSLSLQNIDYAADNNSVDFQTMKTSLQKRRAYCISFGSAAVIASSIPLFNLLAVPAAVAGGTALWLEQWPQDGKPQ